MQTSQMANKISFLSVIFFLFTFSALLALPSRAALLPDIEPLEPLTAHISKPTAVAVDDQGRIYVAETLHNHVKIFSQDGRYLGIIPKIAKPVSVTVDSSGRIYVGSAWQGSVTVFAPDFRQLFKLGGGDNEFGLPADIAVDSAGKIYVADKERNEIRVFSGSNPSQELASMGQGLLHHPTSIAVDSISSELVVLDRQLIPDKFTGKDIEGARLLFFYLKDNNENEKKAGDLREEYAKFGYDMNNGQLIRPVQVAVDKESRVYITDTRLQKVMVYNNSGGFQGMIDNASSPLRIPLGLAFSSSGRLYVASMMTGRVEVYGIGQYSAMQVAPGQLNYTAMEGSANPLPQVLTITNSGLKEFAWTATTDAEWIVPAENGGVLQPSLAGSFDVSVNIGNLPPGEHKGTIEITAPGMVERLAIVLTLTADPVRITPNTLSFTSTIGTTPSGQSLTIDAGSTPFAWNAAADQGWISINQPSGSTPAGMMIYADISSLPEGTYTGMITFTFADGGPGPKTVPVSLALSEPEDPSDELPELPAPGRKKVKIDGRYWSVVQPLPGIDLNGVWGSGDHQAVFAVGDNGTILHYDGKKWAVAASGTAADLHSIWGSSATDIHAVGDNGTVLYYDGSRWSSSAPVAESLLDVWGDDTTTKAAGTFGAIVDLDDSDSTATGTALRSIWGSSAEDIFAAGESGTVLHYNGSTWARMATVTDKWLNGIWGSSSDNVFAVGEEGTIIHYDGSVWKTMTSGISYNLHGIWGSSADDVFAVGDGGIVLHYNGKEWKSVMAGSLESLHDIWVSDKAVVYAVGTGGIILEGRAGFPWNLILHTIQTTGVLRKYDEKNDESDTDIKSISDPINR